MRVRILRLIPVAIFTCLVLTPALSAQMDVAKIYKTNCELCHGPDGSGNTGTGKAMHARDLGSDETQKQSDAALTEVISKGRGKMPAFGKKIKPEDITKLLAYIRVLAAKK